MTCSIWLIIDDTDDTKFHACDSNLEDLLNKQEHDTNLSVEWFDCNYMKLN